MSGRVEYPGDLTVAEMTEAAIKVTVSLQPLWSKVLSTLSGMLHGFVAVIAGLGVLHFFFVVPGGEPLGLPVVVGVIGLSFLWVWGMPQILFRSIYGSVVSAPFQEGLRIAFGPDGVEHWNGRSRWVTDWRDVTDVIVGKRVLSVAASGIALPVALRHVEDPEALSSRIDEWREAAR